MPATMPPHSAARRNIWLLTTSSVFCSSPCTLTVLSCTLPSMSASAPKATLREIALQASDTSVTSALRSPVASGWRRRSSMRNWVRVGLPPVGMTVSYELKRGSVALRVASSTCSSSSGPDTRSGSSQVGSVWWP